MYRLESGQLSSPVSYRLRWRLRGATVRLAEVGVGGGFALPAEREDRAVATADERPVGVDLAETGL